MKYLMYGCKEIEVTPLIQLKNNIGDEIKQKIFIDECLVDEIISLWNRGIRTTGCCCGHGCSLGFIQVVSSDIEKMENLGYQHYLYIDKINDGTRKDAFIPQTVRHKTTRLIDYKWEIQNLL